VFRCAVAHIKSELQTILLFPFPPRNSQAHNTASSSPVGNRIPVAAATNGELLLAGLRVSRKDIRIPMKLDKEIQRKEAWTPKVETITILK
jgi:hypothetical protein